MQASYRDVAQLSGEGVIIAPDPTATVPQQPLPCCLYRHARARRIVLFFHANAEDLGQCDGFARVMAQQLRVHVLAVEYPGYGAAPGKPSEATLLEAGERAVQHTLRVLGPNIADVVFMGRSVGTGVATYLAGRYQRCAGLVLISPFASIRDVVKGQLGVLGALGGVVPKVFDNKERIRDGAVRPWPMLARAHLFPRNAVPARSALPGVFDPRQGRHADIAGALARASAGGDAGRLDAPLHPGRHGSQLLR